MDNKADILLEPPEEHLLPLVSGVNFIRQSFFRKNQFGEVSYDLFVDKPTLYQNYDLLFIFPVGFRPFRASRTIASVYDATVTIFSGVEISTNGEARIIMEPSAQNRFRYAFAGEQGFLSV